MKEIGHWNAGHSTIEKPFAMDLVLNTPLNRLARLIDQLIVWQMEFVELDVMAIEGGSSARVEITTARYQCIEGTGNDNIAWCGITAVLYKDTGFDLDICVLYIHMKVMKNYDYAIGCERSETFYTWAEKAITHTLQYIKGSQSMNAGMHECRLFQAMPWWVWL